MLSNKPKKFSVFVAVLILFFGVFFGGFLFIKSKSGSASISGQISYLLGSNTNSIAQDKNLDSDSDGLPDWQEKIYKTDPKKADTDGDGYMDGEEVASGYDPTKKAPNDALPGTDASKARPMPKNLTKALSQKLGQAILSGKIASFNKETGQPLTAKEIQSEEGLKQLIEEASSQMTADFSLPDIPNKEIKISIRINEKETLAYLDNLGQCLHEMPKKPESELQFLYEAVKSRNFSKVKEISGLYEDTYNKLKQVTVPPNMVSVHKRILGVLWATNNIYKAVINIDQDPLKTTIAFMSYENIAKKTEKLILDMIKERAKFF
ncbi:MAG: hypothetical protein A2Y98_01335 [Candidatus Portnoybacteria bacterium RBG_19FT_COMBO_36_7]|uniref:EF-hand domain-containing protein n=1 Tax=Candidatus Portnoybacteria bacterium RBG_19FT_COMBO_36_7 TaxID=1801992 RepID=A0A1G2F7F8_9BACT|nr:MAG: hypothetical protein A2Y98_01335 [Candidatus Portnoybacteria bacterium RBG_19FT_COMBO_36_7]